MNIKYVKILFFVICVFVFLIVSPLQNVYGAEKIIMAACVEKNVPFSYMDNSGNPAGFDIELLNAVSRISGFKTKIDLLNPEQFVSHLENVKHDVILGRCKNNTNSSSFDFSFPYLDLENSIYVRKGEFKPQSNFDFRNRKIVVAYHSIGYDSLKKTEFAENIIPVSSSEQALIQLASGKYDCAVILNLQAEYIINKRMLLNIERVEIPFSCGEYCFAVKKGNQSLVNSLNSSIAILKANGEFDKIYNKWFGQNPAAKNKDNVLMHYLIIIIIVLALIIILIISFLFIQRKRIKKRTDDFQKELTDRKRIENILIEREEMLNQATKIALLGSWIWDSNANVLICSPEVFKILGVTDRYETLGVDEFYTYIDTEDREKVKLAVQKSFVQKTNFESEFRVIHPNGDIRYVRAKAEFSYEQNATVRMTGVMLDVTDYKTAHLKIEYSNRLYSFLSQVNEVIVNYQNLEKLYSGICNIGIKYGKFDLVWIGTVEEKSGWVKIESYAGKEEGYLQNQKISVYDNSYGQGTVGFAYRNDSYHVFNDLTRSTLYENAKQEAIKRGFRSSASFVIRKDGRKIGAITYYSKELNFFNDTEIKLLEEIAENISFAIDNVEKENIRNITRRALQESQEKYLSVFNAVSDPIFLLDQNTGTILDANVAAARLYGYHHDELLNLKIMDMSAEPSETAGTLSDNIEIITNRFHKRKDGSIFPVEVMATYFLQNNRKFAVTVIRDLTEVIKSREKLIESEKRYSSLFQKNRAVMILFDAETGSFVDMNSAACQYYGYEKDQFLNMTIADINVLPTEKCFEEIEKVTNNQNSHLYLQHRLANGEIRDVEAFTGLMTIVDKKVYYSIIYDITERRKAELELIAAKEKAEEASRLKTSLLGNMSHELRTPLTGILGFSQILIEEVNDEFLGEMVEKILRSGKRLMTTLNSILNISELESSRLDTKISELNLAYSVKERLYEFEKLAAEKNISFDFKPIDKNVFIYADQNFLNQIVESLVDNAIKYTEIGGVEIVIDSEQDDGKFWGVMKICDTGIGIPKHLHDLIFEEFRQASEGFNRSFEGSGLGLTLAKKMITLLGGAIELESDLGKGSVFTVKLPGYLELNNGENEVIFENYELNEKLDTITAEMETMADTKIKNENLPLLLLVEDNFINSDVTIMFLKGICNVDHAIDGENAIHMSGANQYDAILMDINLGGKMNGIEALREIRNIPGYESTPVVALTGYAMSTDRERLINEGFNDYMAKPFDKEDIINLVKLILKK